MQLSGRFTFFGQKISGKVGIDVAVNQVFVQADKCTAPEGRQPMQPEIYQTETWRCFQNAYRASSGCFFIITVSGNNSFGRGYGSL